MPTTYDRPWLAGWDGTGEGRAPPWRDTRELERGQFRFACHLSWPEESLGLSCACSDDGGVTVVGVDSDSPAERAGLRRGMRVVSVCGHSIYTESDLVQARTFAARDGACTVSVTATNVALRPPTSPGGRDATSYSVADAVAIRTMPHLLTRRHPQPRPPPPPPAAPQQHLASPHSHHRNHLHHHHAPSSPRSPSSWIPGSGGGGFGGGSSSSLFRVTGGGATAGVGGPPPPPHSTRSGAYGEAAVDRYGSSGLSLPHAGSQPGAALWQDRPQVDREATYMGGRPFPPLTASLPPKIR